MKGSSYESGRFLREGVVEIDAAVVGISSNRWISLSKREADTNAATLIMKSNRFDVLPISDDDGVKEYFYTERWDDYSSVVRGRISHKDVVPFTTPLRDVIKGFALDSRRFYFLSDERRIVGLISVANLNCRQVKVYLFSLLCELEIGMGNLISRHCSEPELLSMTFGGSDVAQGGKEVKPKHVEVKRRFEADKDKGLEVPFVEYLYLTDMKSIVKKKRLFERLGYQSSNKFQSDLSPLIDLRHAVAHPTRSLVDGSRSFVQLWAEIDRIEELLFALR